MRSKLLSIFLAVVAPCALAQIKNQAVAKQATIEFSPVSLTLGMPKGRVVTQLAEYYDISPWKGQGRDLWGVARKSEPHFLVGTMTFEANKLSFASRMWENSNTAFSAVHVTANLVARLRKIQIDRGHRVTPAEKFEMIPTKTGHRTLAKATSSPNTSAKDARPKLRTKVARLRSF